MAWDSSSSSDEPLQQRASRRILSGRTPRQIPLLADSSDEEIASVSPKIVKPREGEKAEQDAKSETGDSRDSSPAKELSLAKFAPEKPENVESNVADVAPADTSLVDSNSERSESKSVVRTGWRFKAQDRAVDSEGNCADRSKSPRSPGRRAARWNSQAMKIQETSETQVFERLYNDFLQKTQVEKLASKEPRVKESEGQVFDRLYEDALVKRHKREAAEKREAKEKEEEQQLLRLQAPEEQVMAMCQRLYDRRKVKETTALEPPKLQDPADALETNRKLHSFVQHQSVWNANRVARAEAERVKQLDSERRYLEENSIHRSLTPVHGCYDRLYKDFDKRAARLEKLRNAQQSEDRMTPKSSPRPGVDTTEVSTRLHGHFEERKNRLDQKRKEQEEYIRWRSQDPRSVRSARSQSPRTPSTATALSQTSSESTWRTRPGTPRGNSRSVTPDKSRSPRNAARAGANSANQGSKEAKPELEAPRKPPQPQPDPQDQPTEAKAKSEKSETSLRAEVEVSIISARGAILMETKDDSWTCSVEVGAAAKPKKIILQTEQQMGRSPVWDSKAQATLFQPDVLQFKICNAVGCMAQTSLSVASILMICYSGFDGELKLQPTSPVAKRGDEDEDEDDATYLHVSMRVLVVTEKRQIPDCDVEKIPEESEKNAESAPHSHRKVHPHEGYKAKPYGIVTEQMRRQTDRMKDRTKPGMSLKSSKSSTVGTAFRSAAPGGRQSQEAPNARGASRKPLVQSAPKGPNGPQTPKRKETSNAGKDQQPQDSKIQVPTEEHKVQPDQHHQPRKLRQRSRIRTMRSVSFDRSTRSTPGDSYEVEILITEPFLTVNIEDEFLPRHLRREMT
ncbi:unnamed protein product [Cladocopium goreaui]|uniref:Reverse transcriptase Ty1/copia-type domain-containing protein n=1 Tax=Cladocopium goreaui TaxID=2562237 RepID=A0A9P1C025_9DINO|nr:unnamed protein product [Cladocopium goreaui]